MSARVIDLQRLFPGDSEMAGRMRRFDWSRTSLGPVEEWPPSLRTALRMLLASKTQILLLWGDDYVVFYNDAYRPVFGSKHPSALGIPVRDAWSEIWLSTLKGLFDGVVASGEAYWATDRPFFLERHGYLEETYFDVSYDPVRDDSGVVRGVYCIVTETTERVVGPRRLTTLRDLGRITQHADGVAEVYRAAAAVLLDNADVPFSLFYGAGDSGRCARLLAAGGLAAGSTAAPLELPSASPASWPLGDELTVLEDEALAPFGTLCAGPWPEPIRQVAVVPIAAAGQPPEGWFVAGISPRRKLDDDYRVFLGLVASNVAAAVTTVRRTEDERRRAEMLAELDRAKTAFFSNVSHEFRTPLTLMLGPLEEAMAAPEIPRWRRDSLDVAHRNSLRLLRLVNTLLDFSRIEAGRMDASFEAVDVATLTAELVSVFRSAAERAGLALDVRCETPAEPVYLDRDMWEKIVLNLLSNAFKFTFVGGITVTLVDRDDHVELAVRDTGVGIPADELPHVFERFHRVRGTEGRTHEGTGIGLALVSELVKLHGGQLGVASELGAGTTFTLRIPTGAAHLPPEGLGGRRTRPTTSVGSAPFVAEALRWLPETEAPAVGAPHESDPGITTRGARILVADDNADMRAYIVRLLAPHWQVEAVGDGEAALAAIRRRRPDLVLSDVMMPRLDGIALTRAIRNDGDLVAVPVILVSARAGEESRIEGVDAQADDYLTKPFSARELVARVHVHLELARVRREAEAILRASEERFRSFVTASADVVYRMSADWTEMRYLVGRDFIPDTAQPDRTWLDRYIHPEDQPRVLEAIERAIRTKSAFALEHRVVRVDGSLGWTGSRAIPLLDEQGEIVEWFGTASDLTERKRAEEALRQSEERARVAQSEAEAANRAKDDFLATVSHELRSPLQGILGWLTLLKRGQLDAPQTTRALEAVERSVRLQAQLVHDIMDISRIVAGKVELEQAPLDPGTVLKATSDEFAPSAAAKRIDLMLESEPGGVVMGDRERLHQVFSNLIANALKFTPEGGRITLARRLEDAAVVVRVRDTGVGIDPEFLPRLFDRFTQADTSSTRRYGGLGLGLAIVRHLVELNGGTVSAESAGVGCGATFSVRLPVALAGHDDSRRREQRANAPRLDDVEIVLVEDDLDSLEAMALALEGAGARVRRATSAEAAWSSFRLEAPDVVVSDLSMPDEDGYSLLRRIRGGPGEASVPVIALTGFTRPEDKARVRSAGFAAHVAKPIDADQLVRVIVDVLALDASAPADGSAPAARRMSVSSTAGPPAQARREGPIGDARLWWVRPGPG